MKIEDTWKSLNEGIDGLSDAEIRADMSANKKGLDPVQKLNKRLAWKIFFTILFLPMYVAVLFYVDSWLPQLLFAIIIVAHLIGLVFFIQRYRRARTLRLGAMDTRTTLKLYIENVKATLRQEELGGLILYPIAAAGGFFLSLLEEMTLDEALADQRILITLLVLVIILTPVSHWLARWMNRKTFGRYLRELEERLRQIESED